jgi:hypothetical protein
MGVTWGDGASIDDVARDLASGTVSRRTALRRLAGGAFGIGLAAAPSALADGIERARCPDSRKCGKRCCPRGAMCKQGKCRCKKGRSKCGKKCCATGETCQCVSCPQGETLCGDICTHTNVDSDNCGGCGTVCAANEICTGGECVIDAASLS